MKRGKVVKNSHYPELVGICGNVDNTLPNKMGNVMFYPDDMNPFYCIVLDPTDIEYL